MVEMQRFSRHWRVLITSKGSRFTINYVTKLDRTRRDIA